jgi:hypothetical protein
MVCGAGSRGSHESREDVVTSQAPVEHLVAERFWGMVRRHPSVLSLLVLVGYIAAFLLTMRIGYGSSDDPAMISMVSGYSGMQSEFLVFTNVLLGLLLKLLYQLRTGMNVAVLFFFAVNMLSVWGLVYEAILLNTRWSYRAMLTIVILLFNSCFLVSITFTTVAAIAATAGFLLLVSSAREGSAPRRAQFVLGLCLVALGGLIRVHSTLMIGAVFTPPVVMNLRKFNTQRLALACLVAVSLLVSSYLFDRIYVREHHSWDAFYAFNSVRSGLLDTPRGSHAGDAARAIHWTANDYLLFTGWIFLDRSTVSLDNLRYLLEHTSNVRRRPGEVLRYLSRHTSSRAVLSYLMLFFSAFLGVLVWGRSKSAYLIVITLTVVPLAVLLGLACVMKLTDRVVLPLLASSCLLGFFLGGWFGRPLGGPSRVLPRRGVGSRFGFAVLLLPFVLSVGLVMSHLFAISNGNRRGQVAYQGILASLDELVTKGTIPEDAIILGATAWGPRYGIPIEWANPWRLDFPRVDYQVLGWLAFSPVHDSNLSRHGIRSLPRGLYENQNVYLTTRPDWIPPIIRLVQERESVNVTADQVCRIPDTDLWLYSFRRSR